MSAHLANGNHRAQEVAEKSDEAAAPVAEAAASGDDQEPAKQE